MLVIVGVTVLASVFASWMMSRPLPGDAVAMVNGTPISQARFETALGSVLHDARSPEITNQQRDRVLRQLINEELLVQEALRSEIYRTDRDVRNALVSAMMDRLRSRSEDPRDISGTELKTYFKANKDRYRPADRAVLRVVRFEDKLAADRARAELEAGTNWDSIEDKYAATEPDVPIPSGPLTAAKMAQYVGSEIAGRLDEIDARGKAFVVPSGDAFNLIWVRPISSETSSFESIRSAVVEDYLREERERAWARKLDSLRESATIQVRDELASQSTPW